MSTPPPAPPRPPRPGSTVIANPGGADGSTIPPPLAGIPPNLPPPVFSNAAIPVQTSSGDTSVPIPKPLSPSSKPSPPGGPPASKPARALPVAGTKTRDANATLASVGGPPPIPPPRDDAGSGPPPVSSRTARPPIRPPRHSNPVALQLPPEISESGDDDVDIAQPPSSARTNRIPAAVLAMVSPRGEVDIEWSSFDRRQKSAAAAAPAELKPLFEMPSTPTMEMKMEYRPPSEVTRSDVGNAFSFMCVDTYTRPLVTIKGSALDDALDKNAADKTTRRFTVNVTADKAKLKMKHKHGKSLASAESLPTASDQSKPKNRADEEEEDDQQPTQMDVTILDDKADEDTKLQALKKTVSKSSPTELFARAGGTRQLKSGGGSTGGSSAMAASKARSATATGAVGGDDDHVEDSVLALHSIFSKTGFQLMVEFEQLRFTAGTMEPFFCSATLHDLKRKTRVSETIYFELNSEEQNNTWSPGRVSSTTTTRRVIFSPPCTRAEIVLIVRVAKILRGDIEKDSTVYMKSKAKTKELEKIYKETDEIIRSGDWALQPFVWTVVPLFDDNGNLSGKQSVTVEEFRPFRNLCSDEVIYEALAAERDGKKGKIVPATFIVQREKLGEELPPNCVSPSNVPMIPFGDGNKVIKVAQSFAPERRPFMEVVNNLYFYGHSVQLKAHHANIEMQVCLKESDVDADSDRSMAVYGTWHGPEFVDVGKTSVTYHERKPQFQEEIKFKLPTNISDKHHLVVTFYNWPMDKRGAKTVLARAVIPLIVDGGKPIRDGRYSAPLMAQCPPHYRQSATESITKWMDNKKPLFEYEVRMLSSIFPQDDNLYNLADSIPTGSAPVSQHMDTTSNQSVANLVNLPPPMTMQFFPTILDCLFRVMVTETQPGNASQAVTTLIHVINSVRSFSEEKSDHNTHLIHYVRYLFNNVEGSPRFVYEALTEYWVFHLENRNPLFQTFRMNWFLLSVIVKSMALHLCKMGTKCDPTKVFSSSFRGALKKLVLILFCKSETENLEALTSFPLFIKDVLAMMDMGYVFEMIYQYISTLDPQNNNLFSVTVKFTFFKIITDFRYYVPLNIPTEVELAESTFGSLSANWWKEHFLAGLLLREVRMCLLQKKRIREQAVGALRVLMSSHDADIRYKKPPAMLQRIASLYFPLLPLMMEGRSVILSQFAATEQLEWTLCFFWVIKNLPRGLFEKWLLIEPPQRHEAFFALLEAGLNVIYQNAPAFHRSAAYVTFSVLLRYFHKFKGDLNNVAHPALGAFIATLNRILDSNDPTLLSTAFEAGAMIVNALRSPLFERDESSLCEPLCFQLLRLCNSGRSIVRNRASALFFYWLQINYATTGDLRRMHIMSTVAVSKLVGEERIKNNMRLRESLDQIIQRAEESSSGMPVEVVKEVVHPIMDLITYNDQIALNRFDPQLMADLYKKIADSWNDSPGLRIAWLENLASLHHKNSDWEESAQTKVILAFLVTKVLDAKGTAPFSPSVFKLINPNVEDEPPISLTGINQGDQGTYSIENLIKFIQEAVSLMKQIENLRMMANYYRVKFYGEEFGDIDEKEFIYKFGGKENLMTVQNKLKEVLIKKVADQKEENVVILHNKDVDRAKLEPGKLYLQLASVKPYFPPEEVARINEFEENFNIRQFIFEAAFSKNKDDATASTKKKVIFETTKAFPYCKTRLEVCKKTEIILTPLENAIELIQDRIARIQEQLDNKKPSVNQLQQLLQGSVVPMVNEGPLKVCTTFLAPGEAHKYPKHQVDELKQAMGRFVHLCGFAVKLNKSLIGPEHMQFQTMVESHYDNLKTKVREYTDS